MISLDTSANTDHLPDRCLVLGAVLEMTGISRAELYAAMADERAFPKPIRVTKKRNGWLASEVLAWLRARPRAGATKPRPPRKDGKGLRDVIRARMERAA